VLFPEGAATKATATFKGLNLDPITITITKPDCDAGPR